MYKLILVVFLGVLYNSLTVEAQVFSPCPHSTEYVCDDQLDTDSVCLVIFNGSNPNNGTIDPKCQNSTYTTAAAQCPYTCGACCLTGAYNCQNAPAPNPFNCAVLTKTQCEQASAQAELAQYCPATCGLCQYGSCVDLIDCTGLSGGCFDPSTQAFMYANCARTCGCVNSNATSPIASCASDNAKYVLEFFGKEEKSV
uniref:ShKT domain-containing protein n=1 Tax=Acrobeloides nanus TaxID=290746 RepID=A0A914CH02_9BILA